MAYDTIREEELKNKVAQDFFHAFDCTKIVGNLDFCVTLPTAAKAPNALFETESLFWAEAKKGKAEITKSMVQLILTIGKARTFDKYLPPAFLGAFDAEKIAFMPYNDIQAIFYQNDFNWNVTPSNYETKEFKQIYHAVVENIENNAFVFFFERDANDLKSFVKTNFIVGKSATSKIQIDKNNFMVIYKITKAHFFIPKCTTLYHFCAKKGNCLRTLFYQNPFGISIPKPQSVRTLVSNSVLNPAEHLNRAGT